MKRLLYIPLFFILTGCVKDALNKKPLDLISDAIVWNDQVLTDAYLTNTYIKMTILENETPNMDWASSVDWNGPFILNEISDEGYKNWIAGQSQMKYWGIQISGGLLEWWEQSYAVIRDLNVFIEKLSASTLPDDYTKNRTAEAKFLRAFNYFQMVKRYGGVPIILSAQAIDAPNEELFRKRNTEKEVYDFVISEMDAVAELLAEKPDLGRPSKYAALALKCRAALYAGSIAKYGTQQLNGLLGFPASDANIYYQHVIDAATKIINSNSYSLYNSDADKVLNFKNVFLKKMAEGNPESIWVKAHDYNQRNIGGNGWVWDFFQCPKPQAWNAGNQNAPYLEMAEEFEYKDGTPGKLNRATIGNRMWTINELWGNKDPRFFATLYTQETPWKGDIVDFHNGVKLPDGSILTTGAYNGIQAKGPQTTDGSFGTSFGVMKYLEESKNNIGERATSGTDWIIFRLGEVILNCAEAALELGRSGEALGLVNQIRNRAGIVPLTSVTRDNIRHERKVELAFEGHRYWDLRRWRIATTELTVSRSGIRYIQDYTKTKYQIEILEKIDGSNSNPVFYNYNYYFPITLSRTTNNSNLIENPGYN